jgi:hypothetical protein
LPPFTQKTIRTAVVNVGIKWSPSHRKRLGLLWRI